MVKFGRNMLSITFSDPADVVVAARIPFSSNPRCRFLFVCFRSDCFFLFIYSLLFFILFLSRINFFSLFRSASCCCLLVACCGFFSRFFFCRFNFYFLLFLLRFSFFLLFSGFLSIVCVVSHSPSVQSRCPKHTIIHIIVNSSTQCLRFV